MDQTQNMQTATKQLMTYINKGVVGLTPCPLRSPFPKQGGK